MRASMRERMTRERMISITALVLVIRIGFLVPKAAAQSDKYSKMAPVDQYLTGGLGEAGHHRLSSKEPARGLPPADVHDARRRHCAGESDQYSAYSFDKASMSHLSP